MMEVIYLFLTIFMYYFVSFHCPCVFSLIETFSSKRNYCYHFSSSREWGNFHRSDIVSQEPCSFQDEIADPPWVRVLCEELSSKLSCVKKIPLPAEPIPKPPTQKRPRPATPAVSPLKEEVPASGKMVRTSPRRQTRSHQVRHEETLHEQDIHMLQLAKDVDMDEFHSFVDYLQRFARRYSIQTDGLEGASLHMAAKSAVITELRERVLLYSASSSIAHVEPTLLKQVVSILQKLVETSLNCFSMLDVADQSKEGITDATLGILSASTALAILCAPGSPRNLMVEELLESVVALAKKSSECLIFPLCDPLYKASNKVTRRKDNRKNSRRSRFSQDVENDENDVSKATENRRVEGRSGYRRALLKREEAFLDHCYTFLESLTDLFQKEHHLPESDVSHCASLCIHSLSVTGINRFQSYAMKMACMIFSSYPVHRLSILDDLREVISIIPAARKHLRCFQVLGAKQTTVRSSSALFAQLLCAASIDPKVSSIKTEEEEAKKGMNQVSSASQKASHDRAVKMAMHVLDPLLKRAYSDREVEYRTAFQSLFDDILVLYGKPEWPSAELMLQTISVAIITRLRAHDEKSAFARSLSIDILGALASKMCSLYGSDVLKDAEYSQFYKLKMDDLESEREKILLYLDPEKSPHFAAANSFYSALFLADDHGIANSFTKKTLAMAAERKEEPAINEQVLDGEETNLVLGDSLHAEVDKNAAERAGRVASRRIRNEDVSRSDAIQAATFIGKSRSFTAGFRTILEAILDGMHDPAPTVRAKSIKALSSIDETSHGLLKFVPNALSYIEASCRDVSTLARDAALELLSRTLLNGTTQILDGEDADSTERSPQDTALLEKVFSVVEKRLSDTAISVRKRAITIMRSLLSDTLILSKERLRNSKDSMESLRENRFHEKRIVQICACLVPRLDDPERNVRDAAELTLRLGLFGFNISQQQRANETFDDENANQLAGRLITLFIRLPTAIHLSFMSRIMQQEFLIQQKQLLASIVDASVEQMHDCEARISSLVDGVRMKSLPFPVLEKVNELSVRRVACSSAICAFGSLDSSFIVPHCRSLAPSIKNIHEGIVSENDQVCVQRILNVLEIGLGNSESLETTFLEEVMHDIDIIICTSPMVGLEEAAIRCLCTVSKKASSVKGASLLENAARTFKAFLTNQVNSLREYCAGKMPSKPTALERNARVALVRLGLLIRFGDFSESFVEDVYKRFEAVFSAVTVVGKRDLLARASVQAISHLFIRHRSFLTPSMQIFISFLESSNVTNESHMHNVSENSDVAENIQKRGNPSGGVQLCVLQGFHELLRNEEERNSSAENISKVETRMVSLEGTNLEDTTEGNTVTTVNGGSRDDVPKKQCEKPILAAEEDADAGFLALSAQAMVPCLQRAVYSASTLVRRTVANILGLLVRQGLLLPATVVTALFSLLLDPDVRCREYSFRVVAFLADRYSGMLASAIVPALRVCFEASLAVISCQVVGTGNINSFKRDINSVQERSIGKYHERDANSPVLTVERIIEIATEEKTGLSLLSPALMTIRRDQRRGVFESLMREFDPRVVVQVASHVKKNVDTPVHEDGLGGNVNEDKQNTNALVSSKKISVDDVDDDVGQVSGADIDISATEMNCSLPTLFFLACNLATIDYTNGAGIGGSLAQGGGTAAADTKLKYAKEDVGDLVGIATRIISNSGQAILRVIKQIQRAESFDLEKKFRVTLLASRMSALLLLKHHLKVERWKVVEDCEKAKQEGDISAIVRMPAFLLKGDNVEVLKFDFEDILISENAADEQLNLFCKLMREDAIDECDISVPTRRGARGGRTRGTWSKINKSSKRKGTQGVSPPPKRTKHYRRATTTRKLNYEDDSEDDGSDFDPMGLQ